jgi:hypothetical protein
MTDTIKKLQEVREALAYAASYRFGDGDVSHWMQKNLATLDAVIAGMAAQVMGELFTGATRTPEDAEATGAEGVPAPSPATNSALTPEQREELLAALKPFSQLAREAREFRHSHDSTCLWRIKASDLFAAEEAEKRLLGKEQPNDR